MVDGIGMALTSLKSASDLTKSLLELRDAAKISEISIELNGKIAAAQQLAIAAQSEQTALVAEINNLKKKIVEFEDWESEKQRYELKAIDRGCFAFMPKPGMENGEPPHWLCANCFENGHKSFLQFKGQVITRSGTRGDTSSYACIRCKDSVTVFYTRNPSTPWESSS